jgi:hypothetical protein
MFDPEHFMHIVRKQGIDWIRSINFDINVNLSNSGEVAKYKNLTKILELSTLRESGFKNGFIKDVEFCLFKDFPFNQLVFLEIDSYQLNTVKSCTDFLLDSYRYRIFDNVTFQEVYNDFKSKNSLACDFEEKLKLCNKTTFIYNYHSDSVFTILDFMVVCEFLLILCSPLLSLFGIISNLFVVVVVMKKENRKQLKDKHYTYMAVYSGLNMCICFIEIISLMSKCQFPYGFYCSSVRNSVFIQYIKIIVVEYLSCVIRLMSNFSYVAFSLNRLALVGKNHNPLTKFVSEVSILGFLLFSLIVSGSFAAPKVLGYSINLTEPDIDYPFLFNQNPHQTWVFNYDETLILIFNGVYDVINYVLFIPVNLAIDIMLLVKLKQVMREKEEKFNDQIDQVKEKIKRENQESEKRVLNMIILNSIVNVTLKVPITITSLNDVRLLFNIRIIFDTPESGFRQWYSFPYTMNYFCSYDRICEIFKSFGNFLYLIALSLGFFFFKYFDKRFDSAYRFIFNLKNKNHG